MILGLLVGMFAMLHEAALSLALVLAFVGCHRAWRAGGFRFAARYLGLLALGLLLGYAPLLMRNLSVGAPLLPQFPGSALAFAVANHADAPRGGAVWSFPSPALAEVLRHSGGHPLPLVRDVLRSYDGALWRWPMHWAGRALTLAAGGENNENLCYAYFKLNIPILHLTLDFRFLLPAALAGMALWSRRRWRASFTRGTLPAALLLYGLFTVAMISAVLPLGRYRLTLLPLLVPFAGRFVTKVFTAARAPHRRALFTSLGLFVFLAAAQWSIGRIWPIGALRPTDFVIASRILNQWGRPDLATAELARGLELGVSSSDMQCEIRLAQGRQFEKENRWAEAANLYRQALAICPNHPAALALLAWLCAASPDPTIRDGQVALDLAQRYAQATSPDGIGALDLLAAAHAELSRFADAARLTEQAIDKAREQGLTAHTPELNRRLDLYRQGMPYRLSIAR